MTIIQINSWQYYRDGPVLNNAGIILNFTGNDTKKKRVKYEMMAQKILK